MKNKVHIILQHIKDVDFTNDHICGAAGKHIQLSGEMMSEFDF